MKASLRCMPRQMKTITVTPNTKKYMKKMMQDTERIYIRTTKAKK